MTSMPWIKSHTSQLDDTRLAQLPESAQLRYFKLYLLAGRLDADGLFIQNGKPLSNDEIAWLLHMDDVKQLKKDLTALKSAGLLHINGKGPEIIDFRNQQISQADRREQWRASQQRHRVSVDNSAVNADRLPVSVVSTPQSKSKSKNRVEKNREGVLVNKEGAANKQPPAFSKDKPKGFQVLKIAAEKAGAKNGN